MGKGWFDLRNTITEKVDELARELGKLKRELLH
jgi:hypothetical protein